MNLNGVQFISKLGNCLKIQNYFGLKQKTDIFDWCLENKIIGGEFKLDDYRTDTYKTSGAQPITKEIIAKNGGTTVQYNGSDITFKIPHEFLVLARSSNELISDCYIKLFRYRCGITTNLPNTYDKSEVYKIDIILPKIPYERFNLVFSPHPGDKETWVKFIPEDFQPFHFRTKIATKNIKNKIPVVIDGNTSVFIETDNKEDLQMLMAIEKHKGIILKF